MCVCVYICEWMHGYRCVYVCVCVCTCVSGGMVIGVYVCVCVCVFVGECLFGAGVELNIAPSFIK